MGSFGAAIDLNTRCDNAANAETYTSAQDMPASIDMTATEQLEQFCPKMVQRVIAAFEPMRRYHRLTVRGLEHIPKGPCILVGNHNGGLNPIDGLFLIDHYRYWGTEHRVYALAHDLLFKVQATALNLPKAGVLRANRENARAILTAGHKLLVFPGGDLDSLRPFSKRKQVRLGGHQGFARLALEMDVPIVPVVSIGAHESLVVLAQGERFARWLNAPKWARVRSFPLQLCLPWGLVAGPGAGMPYWPLPTQVTVSIGPPVLPNNPHRRVIPEAYGLYQEIESQMQSMMDEGYARRTLPFFG